MQQQQTLMKSVREHVNPGDPDQEFFIRQFTNFSELMASIKMFVAYLDQPVRVEGELKRTTSGAFLLKDSVVKQGMLLEFLKDGHWEVGRLREGIGPDHEPEIRSFLGKSYDVELDNLHVRMR